MKAYLDNVKRILEEGTVVKGDRSGTGMISLIGLSEQYTLTKGKLPLLTTRKMPFNKTLEELIWFIKGKDDVSYLEEKNVKFWDAWTHPLYKTIGPMYPSIWRRLKVVSPLVKEHYTKKNTIYPIITTIDQLSLLLEGIRNNPFSRRHYISNVNLGMRPIEGLSSRDNIEMGNMALDTCHREFFVSVREMTEDEVKEAKAYRKRQSEIFGIVDKRKPPKYKLETTLTMRSNDVMLGRPHNIAQYAMMNFILAHVLNMHPGIHHHLVHDSHIYLSHVKNAKELLNRTPLTLPNFYIRPTLTQDELLNGELTLEDFYLDGYQHQGVLSFSKEG